VQAAVDTVTKEGDVWIIQNVEVPAAVSLLKAQPEYVVVVSVLLFNASVTFEGIQDREHTSQLNPLEWKRLRRQVISVVVDRERLLPQLFGSVTLR
jgi:hypothetical protein